MRFTGDNLLDVVEAHQRYLESGGELEEDRADFSGTDLTNAILCGACLFGADFRGADLRGTDFFRADLQRADLTGAHMMGANLYCTNLRGAVGVPFVPQAVPECGSFIGWKRCKSERGGGPYDHSVIVKLLVPEDAQRVGLPDGECRASKVRVLEIQSLDGTPLPGVTAISVKDLKTLYRVGETVEADNFGSERFDKWRPGIYFFLNRRAAVEYGTNGYDEAGNPKPIDFGAWARDCMEHDKCWGTPPAVINDPAIDREEG